MSFSSVFIFSILFIKILCLWVGFKNSSKNLHEEHYFLAGRSVAFLPLFFTFLATQVGGGLFLGAAEESYHYGWSVLLYPLGQALGFVLLGIGVGSSIVQKKIKTTAELFSIVYDSPFLQKGASLLSIFSLFLILSAQVVASYKFMGSLDVGSLPFFLFLWVLVILYTAKGGLKSVISTDIVQASFFITIFVFSFGVIFFNLGSSVQQVTTVISEHTFLENLSWTKMVGWLLSPMLFAVIEQDMVQRCAASGDRAVVAKASLGAALFTFLLALIPIYFGIYAKNIGILVSEGESVLMNFILSNSSPVIAGLVAAAVLLAILSTATSLINAIASNIVFDFGERKINYLSPQGISTLIAFLAIFLSFFVNSIVEIMIFSYSLSISALFVPIILSLYKEKIPFYHGFLSSFMGLGVFLIFSFYNFPIPEIIAILSGLFATKAFDFFSRKTYFKQFGYKSIH